VRLAALLAELSDADLSRLAAEHVRTDERLARPQLCNVLEGAIRSFRSISGFVTNRQPPAFSILALLLESPSRTRIVDGFKEAVLAETRRLSESIAAGEILARDDHLHLYRRAFYEARRNDLDVNESESTILSVLRREASIAQVEHFLIEHHSDFREFWDHENCFEHEMNALRSAGIVFESQGMYVLPEDIAPSIWLSLGLDMPKESARRLFGYLNNAELADVLAAAGSRTSGSKEQRLERLVLEWIQPRAALQCVSLSTLREICRATEAPSSGNKDELIDRVVLHFAQGKDQQEEVAVEVPAPEPRRLAKEQFELLFGSLLHQELSDILRRRMDLRQTGSKDLRIRTLWDAQLSETSLLSDLMNRQLEDILHRLGLRLAGSKSARIERIIEHFAGTELPVQNLVPPHPLSAVDGTNASAPEIESNQALFIQRATNPQASLQPWLEELLSAKGQVRCYATEDENPTKQLKNKLSQAASARNGVLVLLLENESAYLKAREALVDRWMANHEWPKGVAAVALAHPAGRQAIRAIVEHIPNPWSERIRERLFPEAEIVLISRGAEGDAQVCMRCHAELPEAARFCPSCGAPTAEIDTTAPDPSR
jgi:hypothetical protein